MAKEKDRQFLVNAIEVISNAMIKLENEYIAGTPLANLSVKKIHYLTLIKELNFPTITKLAKHLKVTKPTVTNTVSNLLKQGLIMKKQDLRDRRIFYLFLTEKGEAVYQQKIQASRCFAKNISSCLNNRELLTIINILHKILDLMNNQKILSLKDFETGELTDD